MSGLFCGAHHRRHVEETVYLLHCFFLYRIIVKYFTNKLVFSLSITFYLATPDVSFHVIMILL